MTRRLGIHALGLATPIGIGKRAVADALFDGPRCGLRPCPDLVGGETMPVGAVRDPLPFLPAELSDFDCRNNRLMLAALDEIEHDLTEAIGRFGPERIAVVLGTSTSGIAETETAYPAYCDSGAWPNGYRYVQHEAGGVAEFARRRLGLCGPAYSVTTACSSSAKVFASARRLIAAGLCDAALVGGADSLCRFTLAGFGSLEALSPGLCRPFSANRDGINIGEGAAAFLVTAEPAPVMLLGIGESSDAYHANAPDPEGRGALSAMRAALAEANAAPEDIVYINLHGTGTVLNDAMESRVVAALFPPEVPCSSTKGMTGHMLGAAGGCEAAFLWLTIHPDFGGGRLPPHLWDGVPDPALPGLRFVREGDRIDRDGRMAMLSNSYAFGGNNVVLAMGVGMRS